MRKTIVLVLVTLGIAACNADTSPTAISNDSSNSGLQASADAASPTNALNRSAWRVIGASDGLNNTAVMFDGADATAWTSPQNQVSGMFVQIDLGSTQKFSKVILEAGSGSQNYLRSYNVYVSNDPNNPWKWIAGRRGLTATRLEIDLGARTGRFVTVQVGADAPGRPWSVAELWLTGNAPVANGFAISKAININIDESNTTGGAYQGLPLPAADIKKVKDSGIDTVRIMTDGSYFMASDGAFQNAAKLEAAIENVLGANLKAVVDIHAPPYTGFNKRILCGDGLPAFERFLEALAGRLQGKYPRSLVALELMNEPYNEKDCNLDASYAVKLQRMYDAARRGSSDITIILSPLESSSIFRLDDLNDFVRDNPDINTIFTVHYYGPLEFSHQGAFYVRGQEYLNFFGAIPYPSTRLDSSQRTALWQKIESIARSKNRAEWLPNARTVFDTYFNFNNGNGYSRADIEYIVKNTVIAWAKARNIAPSRIWLGEFGVQGSQLDTQAIPEDQTWRVNPIEGATPTDRAEWTRDVRQLFEDNGMPWAYFQFGNGAYSVLQDRNFPTTNLSNWDERITTSLGLQLPK